MNSKLILLASSLFLASCGEEDVAPVAPQPGNNPSNPSNKSYTSDPVWNVVAVPLSTADGSSTSPFSYNTTIKDLKDPSITYWIHVDSGPNVLDRVDDGRGVPAERTHKDSTRVFFTFGAKYLPDANFVTDNGFFEYQDVIHYFVNTLSARSYKSPTIADSNVTLQRWGRFYSPKRFSNPKTNAREILAKLCPDTVELHGKKFHVKATNNFQRPKAGRDTSYPTGVIAQYLFYCPNQKQISQLDSGYLDVPGLRIEGGNELFNSASKYWECKDSLVFSSGKNPIILDDSSIWSPVYVPTEGNTPNFAKSFDGSLGGLILCTVDTKYDP